MNKTQQFQNKLKALSGKIQSNRYMSSISNGLMSSMSVLIAGAIFSLIDSINIPIYQEFLTNTGLKALTGVPAMLTTNIISLYVVFSIAFVLAGKYKQDSFSAGLLTLMAFLMVTPLMTTGEGLAAVNSIPMSYLGPQGLFVAIILGILVSRLYVLITEKNFYIKMPKGVPSTVEKAFAAIVPCILITVVMLAVRGIFSMTPYGDIHTFIYKIVQVPLVNLGGGWVAFLIATLFGSILWFLGVHGTMVVYGVMAPIWTTLRLENLEAFQNGAETLPHLVPGSIFNSIYATMGGSGVTIGLAIALLFAKSKRYSTVGKLTIIPSFLGINEPLMFGLPMVLNTRFVIPLIATPLVSSGLAMIFTTIGILPRLRGIGTPMGTPIFINGFIEGGWRVAVFQVVLVGISFLIYYPFFRGADKEALEQEKAEEIKDNLSNEPTVEPNI